MRKIVGVAALAALAVISGSAEAKKKPKATWQVSRTADPITGATSCILAAYDRAAGMSFTRTGVLYPFVENSSTHGVLVGVSSGGRLRLPTGDIVWRVDDRPFRTLAAANNPPGYATSAVPQGAGAMKELVDQQTKLITAASATSTVASGDTARAMLHEMLAGNELLYRQATQSISYGLPVASQAIGQITRDGVRSIPLDDSFRTGLTACGIGSG